MKLSLHHIFSKIGYNFDILTENSLNLLNLDDLKKHWSEFCQKQEFMKEVKKVHV